MTSQNTMRTTAFWAACLCSLVLAAVSATQSATAAAPSSGSRHAEWRYGCSEAVITKRPGKRFAGFLSRGSRFKIARYSKTRRFAFGTVTQKVPWERPPVLVMRGWISASALCRRGQKPWSTVPTNFWWWIGPTIFAGSDSLYLIDGNHVSRLSNKLSAAGRLTVRQEATWRAQVTAGATGPDGRVYMGMWYDIVRATHRRPEGNLVRIFSSEGQALGGLFPNRPRVNHGFFQITGIGVGVDGSVYTVGLGDRLVRRFAPTGEPLAQWVTKRASRSNLSLAVDAVGDVYVETDAPEKDGGALVERYTANGQLVASWKIPDIGALASAPNGNLYLASDDGMVRIYSPDGAKVGEFRVFRSTHHSLSQASMAITGDGTVYVGSDRISAYTPEGKLIGRTKKAARLR